MEPSRFPGFLQQQIALPPPLHNPGYSTLHHRAHTTHPLQFFHPGTPHPHPQYRKAYQILHTRRYPTCSPTCMDPSHSHFADEMWHHCDEEAMVEEVSYRPLSYPAISNFAFRPLLPAEVAGGSTATAHPQETLQLAIPGAPVVRCDTVDSKTFSPISDTDWANAELESDASTPASASCGADSPATPHFGGGDGGFVEHYFRSGSHVDNGLALTWTKSRGQDAGSFNPPVRLVRESTPMFPMPEPVSSMEDNYHKYRQSFMSNATVRWPINGGMAHFDVAGDNHMLASARAAASSPNQSCTSIRDVADRSNNSASSRKGSTSSSADGARKRVPINSGVFAMNERDVKLREGKAKGWPYKKIKQFYKLKDAESTLRGRWRTITKEREQRLRKPSWEPIDDQLLVEAYDYYTDDRSTKIPWKKIAAYINEHGGHYHFGGATCAKRYRELDEAGRV